MAISAGGPARSTGSMATCPRAQPDGGQSRALQGEQDGQDGKHQAARQALSGVGGELARTAPSAGTSSERVAAACSKRPAARAWAGYRSSKLLWATRAARADGAQKMPSRASHALGRSAMPRMILTGLIRERAGGLGAIDVGGATAGAAIASLEASYPALRGWIVDEQGVLRRHVRLFVGGEAVALDRALARSEELFVVAAISGG